MQSDSVPTVVLLAGPNGSGKSTAAPAILRDLCRVEEFVNADTIAHGLSAFGPERVSVTAGKLMLARLRELAEAHSRFAFETTLASRTFAPWLAELKSAGYLFYLVFLWLPSPDLAVQRVRERVRLGGHTVPEETIRRRYASGLRNFFGLYMSIATKWRMYDNAGSDPRLVAFGSALAADGVLDADCWRRIQAHGSQDRRTC